MYEDKTLVCVECGEEFIFSAGDQEFYAERGFQNEPKRCKACRDARKNATRGPREYFTATCAECGGEEIWKAGAGAYQAGYRHVAHRRAGRRTGSPADARDCGG